MCLDIRKLFQILLLIKLADGLRTLLELVTTAYRKEIISIFKMYPIRNLERSLDIRLDDYN